VLGLHLVGSLIGSTTVAHALAGPGLVLAGLTAVYTAYLFAQARARDLWQSPLLPPHLLVQAGLVGSAALLPFAAWLGGAETTLRWVLCATAAAHLLLVVGETTLTHPTAHAHLAVREMTRGRYARFFWAGAALVAAAVAAPWIGVAAAPLALIGILAYEHAYVQSGQAVPLA
jgi:Ni/Fe-hydrogenase subunit HybB-like protein